MASKKKLNKESAPAPEVPPASEGTVAATKELLPSKSMLDLFKPKGENQKVKRLTLPPVIKPSQVGPGVSIIGKIVDVKKSPVSTYRSMLLIMEHPETKRQFCFPSTAVIHRSLAEHFGIDQEKFEVKKAIGLTLLISGLGKSVTQSGKDVTLFEVGIVED
jgi:hypothetical protein